VYLKKGEYSASEQSINLSDEQVNTPRRRSRDRLPSQETHEDRSSSRERLSRNPTQDYDYFFHALNVENFESKLLEAEIDNHILPSESAKVVYTGQLDPGMLFGPAINAAMIIALIYFLNKGSGIRGVMGMMDITKSKDVTTAKITTTFKDVAGMEEAKAEITEFVSFLTNPQKYKQLGAKIPRGAILFGPPGTGKTLLAKAVAGESKVPFYSMSGSDFVEMFVGVGPARVRDLFTKARKNKSAIIYIDEIDAIGRPRGLNSMYGGGNDERENTLNQLLVEMDGFTENSGIVVMASTNVEPDGLDAALLRPGRFDRQIVVDKPDQKERESIFEVHLKNLKLAPEVNERKQRLAELTPGFTGADIANACNEGGIFAARQNKTQVEMADMEKAIERVIGGIEKHNLPISQEERNVIAYHEAGHAIVSWFSKFCDPLLKISIIPRGNALGYAQYVPKERFIRTYDQLVELIAQALGGRVAEKIMFGHLSTGAKDDLQKITRIAYAAISTFGMSKDVGPLSYPVPGDPSISVQKPYSDHTAELIDLEVRKLIDDVFNKTEALLIEKKPLLEEVAQYLIKNEVMNLEQFRAIVGPRPNPSVDAEK
jgi:ATP-dependent metalloprotease FtsH